MTRWPASSSGKAKGRIWAALPPQPCASSTAGASRDPHRHMAMCRPLCSSTLDRASIRSTAAAAASLGFGGVRNSLSAIATANSGNRTFVLILGRGRVKAMGLPFGLAGGGAGAGLRQRRVAGNELLEGCERSLTCFLVPQEPPVIVCREHDAQHLEADLFGVDIGAQVALFDRQAHRFLRDRVATVLVGNGGIADRPGAVVVLDGGGDHDAAAGQPR